MKKALVMKRTVCSVIAMSMGITVLCACNKLDGSEGLEYELHGDGSVAVIGIGSFSDVDLVIPSVNEDGHTVTEIGDNAFEDCSLIGTVVIPDSVTEIGEGAFQNCEYLSEIELPDDLERLEPYVFSGCTRLDQIEIPESVTYIGEHAFDECSSLSNLELPSDITYIGERAFFHCSGIRNIEIPESVTGMTRDAFLGSRIQCINGVDASEWLDERNMSYSLVEVAPGSAIPVNPIQG